MFKKLLDEGPRGRKVGLLLRGTDKEGRGAGQGSLQRPGSITPHTEVQSRSARVDEGRREDATTPFFSDTAAVLFP